MYIKIKDNIYDVTDYIDYHPGGKLILLQLVSTDINNVIDCTKEWNLYNHSKYAESILSKIKVTIHNKSKKSIFEKIKFYINKIF